MRNRIFRSIFFTALGASLACLAVAALLLRGQAGRPLPALLIGAAAAAVLSLALARVLSKRIVRPIDGMDVENPPSSSAYPEISQLARRLRMQNQLIARQMEDLRQKQEEFKAITENMAEGFIITDGAGAVLSCNKSALDILGKNARPGTNALAPDAPGPLKSAAEAALDRGHGEAVLRVSGRTYQLLANPVRVGDLTAGLVVAALDMTEKTEREALRRDFSSSVSHELKTPLTSIRGISEMLMGGLVRPEDVRNFGRSLHGEAERLIDLVNDILKLSELDAGELSGGMEPVDLYAELLKTAGRLRPLAEEKGLSLELAGAPVWVTGVPSVIDEMIENLCDNAIKYNREHGSVRAFAGKNENGRPELSVSDTGVGIAPEDLPRVFERFYRADRSRSKAVEGTGLGLSIVKHGALCHGAEVKLDSAPGAGTTVKIVF